MARAGGKDRGLYSRINKAGEERWYVRISVQGRYERFSPHGGFPTKREARIFLDDARAHLRHGTLFPERYKAQAYPLSDLINADEDRKAKHPNSKNGVANRRF